jgi:glutathione S-transferase
MPVRWAFEEVGQPYDVHLVSFREMKEPDHRARQPFGQIPTYENGDLVLFESAAIVLHIAEGHPGLLPSDGNARARAIAWMFAAKSTVEPVIVEREAAILMEKDKDWFEARLPILDDRIRTRLRDLSNRLGDADWIDGEFNAGDLILINVLRRPAAAPFLDEFPNLRVYVDRGEARPAFRRAFEAQHAVFEAAQ